MIAERTGRLIALVLLGAAVVLIRLFQVQVIEHEVWAEEAARLVHSGEVIPYTRGRVLDAEGRVLAHDVESYQLAFSYRAFRRGHPVGQLAHARAALEMRAVPLGEALRNLDRWGSELVELTPEAVALFAEGGPLTTATLAVPAVAEPGEVIRARRAADLRFYLRGLLGASLSEWRAVRELKKDLAGASYLELLAAVREEDADALRAALAADRRASVNHLAFLAQRVGLESEDDATTDRVDLLVRVLEESRRAVEGAVASSLFEEAAGFPAGRIAPDTLQELFDLERIRVLLSWDAHDLADWTHRARARWRESWRDGYALPRLVAELTLDPASPAGPDDVLSTLAAVFQPDAELGRALDGEPVDWREVRDLAVLPDLGATFRASLPRDVDPASRVVLPWQDPRLRETAAGLTEPDERWRLLDLARADGGAGASRASEWRTSILRRSAQWRERRFELASELVEGWEELLQLAIRDVLEELRANARPSELGPGGGLRFARGKLDRAEERAAYILRDFGSRSRMLDANPDYDVVYLLTRFPERYPGFEAREARRRVRVTFDGDERPLAEDLIGTVGRAGVRDMQRQRIDERRLHSLKRTPKRSKAQEDELVALVESVLLPDEARGVAGVEGFFDAELRGTNGYREHRGLEDVFGEGRTVVPVVEAIDGRDVRLTLDVDVQRAAEHVINHPEPPYDDPYWDPAWFARPVGAIVLLTPEGDVIAAASAPLEEIGDQPVYERTLRRPTFQPPGSVFKPFVATWALDRNGLDPAVESTCEVMDDGHCGYGGVRCWRTYGHGTVSLAEGLYGSCNAYFAWVGESFDAEDFRGMAAAFGFGRPTGIRTPPPGARAGARRSGLLEEHSPELFARESLNDKERRRAGNGLSVVEATPMQIGRAFAALATGRLPAVRLVAAIGGEELPRAEATPLPFSRATLDRVRAALLDVTSHVEGTAVRELNEEKLGFRLAAKTGSADLAGRKQRDADGRVRKHTWVAGWMPPQDPKAVFVLFVHDTSATSSHGAVHVARQFLTTPAVRAWLAAEGMELAE